MEYQMTDTNTNVNKDEAKKEPTFGDKLKGLLHDFKNAPSTSEIDAFKLKHGDVYLSALSETELFMFRSLTRKEYREINANIQEEKLSGENYEEIVVSTCLLWTSVTTNLDNKAGTYPSLMEQIMQNSNFLSPQMLTNLVIKL